MIHFTHRVGSRGAMLIVLAALWAHIGLVPLIRDWGTPPPDIDVLHLALPPIVRLIAWSVCVAAALIAAFVPPRDDWFGWLALAIMPAERFLSYGWAWLEYQISNGAEGYSRGGYASILYGLMIAAVIVAAKWRPPARAGTTDGK